MKFSPTLPCFTLISASLAASTSIVIPPKLHCLALSGLFPQQVSYPGSPSYSTTNSQFWDQTCILSPTCIFYPLSSRDVSVGIKYLVLAKGQFAVKSGGHFSIPGYNNIDDGVLISTERMKSMVWSSGDTVLQLSAGVLWGEAYAKAAEKHKVVVGGRIPDIGVSGFLLGGGLSYLGAEYGFGCDNVLGFEIVLASGQVVYATGSQYADLYKALKGGSSNYGIVTRFDVSAYADSGGWGGQLLLPMDSNATREKMLDAIVDFHVHGAADKKAGVIASFVKWPEMGLDAFLGNVFYAQAVPAGAPPPAALAGLLAVTGAAGLGTKTLGEIVVATGAGATKGTSRNTFHVGSVIATKESLRKVDSLFHAEFAKLSDVPGLRTVLVFQAIPPSFVYAGFKNGGNPMGLDASRGTVSWISQSLCWSNAADEARVKQAQRNAKEAYMAWATAHGLADRFLYLNDADEFQDVFASYGSENVRFLKKVKKVYDPEGVFEKLMPGGYKV